MSCYVSSSSRIKKTLKIWQGCIFLRRCIMIFEDLERTWKIWHGRFFFLFHHVYLGVHHLVFPILPIKPKNIGKNGFYKRGGGKMFFSRKHTPCENMKLNCWEIIWFPEGWFELADRTIINIWKLKSSFSFSFVSFNKILWNNFDQKK